MKIFEKIRINLKNGKLRIIKLFGISVLQYYKPNNNKKIKIYSCPLCNKDKNDGKSKHFVSIFMFQLKNRTIFFYK